MQASRVALMQSFSTTRRRTGCPWVCSSTTTRNWKSKSLSCDAHSGWPGSSFSWSKKLLSIWYVCPG